MPSAFRLSRRLSVVAVLVVTAALATGCAHHLGHAPTDLDLRHDGSPQAKNHLYQTYQVAYADGDIQRPVSAQYEADAASDVAANYLSTSPAAGAALETPAVALDRFVHDGAFYSVMFGVGISTGIIIGLYTGVPPALQALNEGGDAGAAVLDGGTQMLYGGLAGLVASIPLVFLADFAFKPVVRAVASADYRSAARLYNEDLRARIEQGHDATLTEPQNTPPVGDPPSPTAPPPQPAPMPEATPDDKVVEPPVVDDNGPAEPAQPPTVDDVDANPAGAGGADEDDGAASL